MVPWYNSVIAKNNAPVQIDKKQATVITIDRTLGNFILFSNQRTIGWNKRASMYAKRMGYMNGKL
ncbi:hypothetical protein MACH08_26150 [Oceanobacillus kimchii]|uniref:Uncharacterized protein n=1 Tax=Oceanobacillus kimchii TaxID=746691 RepID=A0ABQ5TIX8_9BACI|nr:hypothetical protein MACH08_26150 [Oceanobacillus kimchii]